ncbi:lonely Cys domain-containing protein, partial [Streptomyces sp. NPDC001177]
MVTALDGTQFRDSDIHSRTIVTSNPALTGRNFIPDHDLGRFWEGAWWLLPTFTKLHHYDPTYRRLVAVENLPPGFWSAVRKYYALHGLPGRGEVSLKKDLEIKKIGGKQFGGHLTRRPSYSDLRTGDKIFLGACWGGAPADRPWNKRVPPDEDPWVVDAWEAVPFGQDVANETRFNILSLTRKSAFVRPSAAAPYEMGSVTSRRLRPGYLAEFVPEPTESELEALARVAGLHAGPAPVSERVRHLALRLVRGLRLTFGTSVEADRDDPSGSYQRLLRGIGALELMRARDPDLGPATPLCSSLLERVARAAAGQSGVTGPAPDAAAYRAVLERAVSAVQTDPGMALTQFVALPQLVDAAQQLASPAVPDSMVRQMLALAPSDAVGARERVRVFWAMVKAGEFLDLIAAQPGWITKALHLPPATVVDQRIRDEFHRLLLHAAALGHDIDNPHVLAALDLVRRGALAPRTRLLNAQGKTQGRNWTSQPIPTVVTDLRVLTPSPTGGPPAETYTSGPWVTDKPGPIYLLNAKEINGHVLFEWEDGSQTTAPVEEVAELITLDTDLVDNPDMVRDARRPPALVPIIPGLSPAEGKKLEASGLPIWYHDDLRLPPPSAPAPYIPTVTSRPGPFPYGFFYFFVPTDPMGPPVQHLPTGPHSPAPPTVVLASATPARPAEGSSATGTGPPPEPGSGNDGEGGRVGGRRPRTSSSGAEPGRSEDVLGGVEVPSDWLVDPVASLPRMSARVRAAALAYASAADLDR